MDKENEYPHKIVFDEIEGIVSKTSGKLHLEIQGDIGRFVGILISLVNSPMKSSKTWDDVLNNREFGNGAIWYGPIDNAFVGDVYFEDYKKVWELKNGHPLNIIVWGIMAEWLDGIGFIPYETLLKILRFSRQLNDSNLQS